MRTNFTTAILLLSLVFAIDPSIAQEPVNTTGLETLNFLVGEWVGDGGGTGPGKGIGGFTYAYDLQGRILVRKNFAHYAATNERPEYTHDDLMITYTGPSNTLKAVYFDNEGHVINYAVSVTPDRSRITFVSEVVPGAPRFRMVYTKVSQADLKIQFEIAPPGKSEDFGPYIEATAKRR